ncbi:MAG: hypothetical protein ACI3ZP_11990 [Candidatus Cryptobacteroides sp.]
MGRLRKIILFMALPMALFSCSEPDSSEIFVRNRDRDAAGRYVFDVDMKDSSRTYSMDFYVAFSCTGKVFSSFSHLPANVLWVSPEGIVYEDNILIYGEASESSSTFLKAVKAPYRKGAAPVSSGMWKAMVSVPADSVAKYGIAGLGMKIIKE